MAQPLRFYGAGVDDVEEWEASEEGGSEGGGGSGEGGERGGGGGESTVLEARADAVACPVVSAGNGISSAGTTERDRQVTA